MTGTLYRVSYSILREPRDREDAVQAALDGSHDSNIRAIARDVFSDHVLAFELTSVLLVIAVVATVMLARKPRKGETT